MSEYECLDQLQEVRDWIDVAIRECQATGNISHGTCQRFREEANALLANWDRTTENTARCLEERPLPPPRDGWPLNKGEDPVEERKREPR